MLSTKPYAHHGQLPKTIFLTSAPVAAIASVPVRNRLSSLVQAVFPKLILTRVNAPSAPNAWMSASPARYCVQRTVRPGNWRQRSVSVVWPITGRYAEPAVNSVNRKPLPFARFLVASPVRRLMSKPVPVVAPVRAPVRSMPSRSGR